jgi:hypothetical protein
LRAAARSHNIIVSHEQHQTLSMDIDLVRRAVLRAIGLGVLLCALPLSAQDPRATQVQQVAREWLAYTDKLDAQGSYKAAGQKFQTTMTLDEWSLAMKGVRTPLGAVSQRTIVTTEFDNSFPGAPTGVYAHVQFRTAFAKKNGGETVSIEREPDGQWRVIGYSIQ